MWPSFNFASPMWSYTHYSIYMLRHKDTSEQTMHRVVSYSRLHFFLWTRFVSLFYPWCTVLYPDIIDYMLHHFRIDCIILLIECWICKLYFDSTRIFTNSSVIVLWLWRLSMVIIACCWSWVGSCHKHGSIWNYQNHCQKYHYQEIIAQVIASVKCRRWKI